ncbi:MAG: nuclear transport factor 2 family protein [bacterium]|nr:nuclear transport factor 2 family protein [bacterium]MXZ77409.1 nuclear transport factor 2 family protein [Acidimicrobiia bacterium]MYE73875.1 nuclear transport factor 2 family protein [Acidimicrobiia bacterium]MYJ61532.1 nuclear transport factor 2 family protein [Acidimicrobiia bacterium]
MIDSARQIENLMYTYAERIDAGNLEGVADLFANGQIVASPDAPVETVVAGRDEVLGMYQGSTRLYPCGTPRTKHVTTNAIIEVDDDAGTASARSYYTVFQQLDDFPLQPIITGRYHDTFHRIDGEWWFDQRTMLVDQLGDLSRHLLFELNL